MLAGRSVGDAAALYRARQDHHRRAHLALDTTRMTVDAGGGADRALSPRAGAERSRVEMPPPRRSPPLICPRESASAGREMSSPRPS